MNTYAEKKNENINRAAANSLATQHSNDNPTFQFVDNRLEVIAQRKLKAIINGSPQRPKDNHRNSLTYMPIQRITDAQTELYLAFKAGLETSVLEALKALSKAKTMVDFRAVVNEMTSDEANRVIHGSMKDGFGLKEEILPYAEWLGEIRNERIATSAEAMEGQLNWVKSSATGLNDKVVPKKTGKTQYGEELTNHFTTWLRREGPAPTNDSNMNCWEACLFAGYKAGILPPWLLVNIYEIAKAVGQAKFDAGDTETLNQAYADAIANVMGAGEATWVSGEEIPRGYLVFFNGASHVAISRGKLDEDGSPAVMSLWCLPGPRPNMQATSVKKINDSSQDFTITYGPAPF